MGVKINSKLLCPETQGLGFEALGGLQEVRFECDASRLS